MSAEIQARLENNAWAATSFAHHMQLMAIDIDHFPHGRVRLLGSVARDALVHCAGEK